MGDIRRALVVLKRTAYDRYVRQSRMPRVLELLARNDRSVSRMQRSDDHHQRTVEELRHALEALGVRATYRARDTLGVPPEVDLVIAVGGDGTLLAVSHNVRDTPMLGINSAPEDSVGYLCGARMGEVRAHLERVVAGQCPRIRLARMQVAIDDEVVHRRVLNDALFAHPHPANTSRYLLGHPRLGEALEEQKSSGIWVSTAAGSTAAIRSAGGRLMPLGSRQVQFVVREPYEGPGTAYALTRGFVRPGEALTVLSKLREGRVYLDGPRIAFPVEMGQRVRFSVSDEPLVLLGLSARALAEREP